MHVKLKPKQNCVNFVTQVKIDQFTKNDFCSTKTDMFELFSDHARGIQVYLYGLLQFSNYYPE